MPYADYLEFMAFYEIEPWGLAVQDTLQANAVQVLANVNRDAEKRPEPYRIKDFLLFAPTAGVDSTPKVEPTVEGKTAAQWQIIFAAEALQASRLGSKEA